MVIGQAAQSVLCLPASHAPPDVATAQAREPHAPSPEARWTRYTPSGRQGRHLKARYHRCQLVNVALFWDYVSVGVSAHCQPVRWARAAQQYPGHSILYMRPTRRGFPRFPDVYSQVELPAHGLDPVHSHGPVSCLEDSAEMQWVCPAGREGSSSPRKLQREDQ